VNKTLLIVAAVGAYLYFKSKATGSRSATQAAPAQTATAQLETAAANAAGGVVNSALGALGIQAD
jgi:hypothetical protein